LLFSMTNLSYAANINEEIYCSHVDCDHDENDAEETIEANRGIIATVVYLSVKMSHYNSHRSYTKIVTKQGIKYEVTYIAIPRSECWMCEYNSY
jgi:hypothetical protein